MAKKGTATAHEPNELYDTLTETEQEVFDLIGFHGFRPDRNSDGEWIGLSLRDDRILGPVSSLSDLAEIARKAADEESSDEYGQMNDADINTEIDSDEIEMYEDEKGPRLPGMPLVVDAQLKSAALEEYADKEAWKEAGKKKKASQDALRAVVAMKKHLFKQDPDNTHNLIYRVGGITIRITKESQDIVRTEREKTSEDED